MIEEIEKKIGHILSMTQGCLGPRFTLTQLIIETITCAITNTASMPPTDIIAMWIQVTLLVCDGCVNCVFSISLLTAASKKISVSNVLITAIQFATVHF